MENPEIYYVLSRCYKTWISYTIDTRHLLELNMKIKRRKDIELIEY